MNDYAFNAYALDGELYLNRIAAALNVAKRFKWEEPLALAPDTLFDINEVFSGLTHARRSARLESIIIVLITLEIALFLLEMFGWKP